MELPGAGRARNLSVRLYFANRCDCTERPGRPRVFDVSVDGVTKLLNNYDIVADVGHRRGTMKQFNVISDGNVDIDFGHVVENPLVNAIEIVNNDAPARTARLTLRSSRTFTGSSATAPAALRRQRDRVVEGPWRGAARRQPLHALVRRPPLQADVRRDDASGRRRTSTSTA